MNQNGTAQAQAQAKGRTSSEDGNKGKARQNGKAGLLSPGKTSGHTGGRGQDNGNGSGATEISRNKHPGGKEVVFSKHADPTTGHVTEEPALREDQKMRVAWPSRTNPPTPAVCGDEVRCLTYRCTQSEDEVTGRRPAYHPCDACGQGSRRAREAAGRRRLALLERGALEPDHEVREEERVTTWKAEDRRRREPSHREPRHVLRKGALA